VIAAGGIGQPYVTTDYPAVQRALELDADALLVAKHGVDGVYSADPRLDPSARRYDHLTFADAIAGDLRVMDPTAFILARDNDLTLHVFDVEQREAMGAIVDGKPVGTEISTASDLAPRSSSRQ
jgi:uridylate kinase